MKKSYMASELFPRVELDEVWSLVVGGKSGHVTANSATISASSLKRRHASYDKHLHLDFTSANRESVGQHIYHGRSLTHKKQLLRRCNNSQPRIHRASSLKSLLHHLLGAIETAPQQLRTRQHNHFQNSQRPSSARAQAANSPTCLNHQQRDIRTANT